MKIIRKGEAKGEKGVRKKRKKLLRKENEDKKKRKGGKCRKRE